MRKRLWSYAAIPGVVAVTVGSLPFRFEPSLTANVMDVSFRSSRTSPLQLSTRFDIGILSLQKSFY